MCVKGSTIDGILALVWMVLSVVSWLAGLGFVVGAVCLILSLCYRIVSHLEKRAERGQ